MKKNKADPTPEAILPNTPRALVQLAISSNSRQEFIDSLGGNLDEYSSIGFTPEEADKVTRYMKKVATGSSSTVPMLCFGAQCPFAIQCPLQQIGKAPVGKSCLIESQLLKDWTLRYMDEFDVSTDSIVELSYCTELAEIDLMMMRLNLSLGKPENAELVTPQTIGIGRDGTAIIQTSISPFLEQKNYLSTRKSKIIKLMVGDRQEKYKKEAALKVKIDADPSSKMATMRRKLLELSASTSALEPRPVGQLPEKVVTPEDIIQSFREGE
jgi:hypothetical protein